jgi:hypothetical protein
MITGCKQELGVPWEEVVKMMKAEGKDLRAVQV